MTPVNSVRRRFRRSRVAASRARFVIYDKAGRALSNAPCEQAITSNDFDFSTSAWECSYGRFDWSSNGIHLLRAVLPSRRPNAWWLNAP